MKPIKPWTAILVLGIWPFRLVSAEPILPPQLSAFVAEAVQNYPGIIAANEKMQACGAFRFSSILAGTGGVHIPLKQTTSIKYVRGLRM